LPLVNEKLIKIVPRIYVPFAFDFELGDECKLLKKQNFCDKRNMLLTAILIVWMDRTYSVSVHKPKTIILHFHPHFRVG